MVPSHICKSPILWALMHPIPSQILSFAPFADNSLVGLFHLWHGELDVHFSWKQAETWTHLTTAHISTAFQSIWDELRLRELGGVSASSWCVVSSLCNRVLGCISGCTSDNDFTKYYRANVYHSSMMISQAMPHEGSKVMHIQQWFPVLPFKQWDFSSFPESFHNFMHCRWWPKDLNSLQSCVEQCCFWTDWQFSHEIWHKVVSHDPSLLAKTELLVDAPFMPNLDTLSCYQWTWLLWNPPKRCYLNIL